MSATNSCRLCFSTENVQYMDIFSVIGIDMNMSEIISEHFKCDVSEEDSLPNFVCQMCWSITEAFHELYQKSKLARERFLNPIIKVEIDPPNLYQENTDQDFGDEQPINVSEIKEEPNLEDHFECNFEPDDESRDELSDNEDDHTRKSSTETNRPRRNHSNNIAAKQKKMKFKKIFAENKHRFDMTCDNCSTVFESLEDARGHYATEHNNPKGYIKCCNVKVVYLSEAMRHLDRHLNPDRFKCAECGKILCSLRELNKHEQRHEDTMARKRKELPCEICKKMFATKSNLVRHIKRHEAKNEPDKGLYDKFIADNFDMTCDQCDATFTTFHDARRHYKVSHNEGRGYLKCCGTKLRGLWIVRDHIKSHMNPDSFKCEVCNKSFPDRMILIKHRHRHRLTMNKSFICDYCGKSCRDKVSIRRHIFTNHVKSEPKYECDICHKKFQLQCLLKNHVYGVHREKKPSVTCEICGKSFYAKFHLDKHMLSHTDKSERLAQRKQCEHCGEWLLTKSGIFYHEQIHTTGIQKCEQCQMELPNKPALLAHIRQYHRAHKFKCSFCEKTFSTAFVLRTHEESHTRHKVYQCEFCPRIFTIPSSRRTHTKRNHPEELKMSKEIKNVA